VATPVVEILYFEDCPNYEQTYELMETAADELGPKPTIELVNVPDGCGVPIFALTR